VVEVTGLKAPVGAVHVALYDKAENFPDDDAMLASRVAGAKKGAVRIVFSGLAAGRYALAAYHDEDGDGNFDQGPMGVPLEGYGFSGVAKVLFGPPSFDEAAFQVHGSGTVARLAMTYW